MFAARAPRLLRAAAPVPRTLSRTLGSPLTVQRGATGLRQFGSCAARPTVTVRRAPKLSGTAALQPWRLAGGSARARLLCTPAGAPAAEGRVTMLQNALSWCIENRAVVGVIAGAVLVMYGFYRGSVRIMKFFFNVSDKQIFTIGCCCGALAAAGIIAAGFATHRHLSLHIDDVYHAAVRELRKHDKVEEKLGGFFAPTGFRGYVLESFEEAVKGSERRARSSYFEAPARRLQMIFQVKGATKDGMVSLEAYKRSGQYHFEMLSLDISDGEHLFLEGSDDHPLFPELKKFMK
jgi:hypothetical protein